MKLETIFPACSSILGAKIWQQIVSETRADLTPEALRERLASIAGEGPAPAYLGDLAALEWAIHATSGMMMESDGDVEEPAINPTLSLVEVRWKNLIDLLGGNNRLVPEKGDERVLVWKVPGTGEVRACVPTDEDIPYSQDAGRRDRSQNPGGNGRVPDPSSVRGLQRARKKGLTKGPSTRIVRGNDFAPDPTRDRTYLEASVFTLQWHLTQACDLSCRHCYDRSERESITFAKALEVLDDFNRFCRTKHVRGAITFTGGNPLLYPDFVPLYRAASGYGFALAVLGNPTERPVLEELVSIRKPDFFQLSLEGLAEHDKWIPGAGSFRANAEVS